MLTEILSANLNLSGGQLAQFQKFYELLIDWNAKMNLTALTGEKDFAIKHVIDSLSIWDAKKFACAKNLIDIGTGAGFPGIPLKICQPDLEITLLDSLNKRVNFLQEVISALNLRGVKCVHGRAEDFAHQNNFRERFDLATARAVARLNVLAEYCLPFVKIGGCFVAMKGKNFREEVAESAEAVKILGGGEIVCAEKNLPEIPDSRAVIYIDKIKTAPKKYPRKAGTPAKSPLI